MAEYTKEEKTAIVLIALGEELAAEVLKNLSPSEVKKIIHAMSRMKAVPQEDVAVVMDEFTAVLDQGRVGVRGGADKVRGILSKAFKTQDAKNFVSEAHITALDETPGPVIATLLKDEHPQTIALILAHLSPQKSGEALKALPAEIRVDLLARISRLEKVDPAIVEELNDSLLARVQHMTALGGQKKGGVKSLAQMLTAMDKENQKKMLADLEEKDPDLARLVRSEMFVFDDLVLLSDRDMQELLKKTGMESLPLALRKTSAEVREKFFKNISERAAQGLRDDLEQMPKVRLEDVTKAQDKILQIAQQLEEDGVITLRP